MITLRGIFSRQVVLLAMFFLARLTAKGINKVVFYHKQIKEAHGWALYEEASCHARREGNGLGPQSLTLAVIGTAAVSTACHWPTQAVYKLGNRRCRSRELSLGYPVHVRCQPTYLRLYISLAAFTDPRDCSHPQKYTHKNTTRDGVQK